jgi:uncharacterized protein (DUF305 family)
MKTKTRALIAALFVAVVAALAAGCGSSGNSTSSTGSTSSTSSAQASGNATDRAFIAEMVPHHQAAVAMAKIAQTEGTSKYVKTLADNIVRTQDSEIAQMQRVDRQLAGAGVKKGVLGMDSHMMGMDMSPDMLKGAKPFDSKFMQMMVPHHTGAIAMAKVELAKGNNAELKTLARNIISAQQREVKEMNAQLKGGSSGSMNMG